MVKADNWKDVPVRYRIAGLDVDCLMPVRPANFEPFRVSGADGGEADMLFTACKLEDRSVLDCCKAGNMVDESDNDAGHLRLYRLEDGWGVLLSYDERHVHLLRTDRCFSRARGWIDDKDRWGLEIINSMLRMAFSQRILLYDGMAVHASAVAMNGEAVLFLGKSGTGKSTHSSMWLKAFPDARLLNDDNPVCRIVGERLIAYGTPWSGKTPCYRNERYPVRAFGRIVRAKYNKWTYLSGVQAWTTVFPSCSFINQDDLLYLQFERTLNRAVTISKVGQIECLPDIDAAREAYRNLYYEKI